MESGITRSIPKQYQCSRRVWILFVEAALGYSIEKVLAWVTILAALIMLTTLVAEAEWNMIPEDTQVDVACSEEITAAGYLAISERILNDSSSDSEVSRLVDDCKSEGYTPRK